MRLSPPRHSGLTTLAGIGLMPGGCGGPHAPDPRQRVDPASAAALVARRSLPRISDFPTDTKAGPDPSSDALVTWGLDRIYWRAGIGRASLPTLIVGDTSVQIVVSVLRGSDVARVSSPMCRSHGCCGVMPPTSGTWPPNEPAATWGSAQRVSRQEGRFWGSEARPAATSSPCGLLGQMLICSSSSRWSEPATLPGCWPRRN